MASSSDAKIWGLLFLNLTMLFRVSGLVSGLFTTFMKYLVRATSLSKDMRVWPSSS